MNQPRLRQAAAFLGLFFAIVGGCNSTEQGSEQQDGHGHGHSHDHDHSAPQSLYAAITQLSDMWADISTAMDNNDPDAAHDPLHDVGKVLDAMPRLAAETDLPESDWNQIKSEAGKLENAFGDIDSAFHQQDGDKQAAYEAVKPKIDAGIAALKAKLPLLGEGQHGDNHGHDDKHTAGGESPHGATSG